MTNQPPSINSNQIPLMNWLRIFGMMMVMFSPFLSEAQIKVNKVPNEVNYFGKTLDSIDLHQSDFYKYVNFASATIKGNANFFLCNFFDKADFGSTMFKGQVEMSNVSFNQLSYFLRAHFIGDSKFLGTNFNSETIFEGAQFDAPVHFVTDSFMSRTAFLNCRFKSFTDFQQTVFKSRTSFSLSVFYDDVSFDGASFIGQINFANAVFLKNLNFSNIQNITNRIDLTVVKTDTIPNRKIKRGINLTNSDISKFKIDYSLFYLVFDTTATFEYRSNVYQSLLNNFKTDGYTESYELLDKEYRTFLYKHKNNKYGLLLDKYWWDFGYSKYYIFLLDIDLCSIFYIFEFISLSFFAKGGISGKRCEDRPSL